MLTDTKCKSIRPQSKTKKYSDSGGMYLEVTPKGGKYWRMKFRFAGKEKRLSIGTYPTVTLAEARAKQLEAKRELATGVDLSAIK